MVDSGRSAAAEASGVGTLPAMRAFPHSIDSERAVLGGVLLEPEALYRVLEVLGEDDFYKDSHRRLFRTMTQLAAESRPVDPLTVSERLAEELDGMGGFSWLVALPEAIPSTANITHYAEIVKSKALLRRLLQVASEIEDRVHTARDDVSEVLDFAEKAVFEVSEFRSTRSIARLSEVVDATLAQIERLYEDRKSVTGVPSGFEELDRMTAGFQPGDLIILAARPSMGKTALSLNVAQNAAIHKGHGIAYFSLEMGKEQLAMRLLCSEARINAHKLRTGHLGDAEWPRLIEAVEVFHQKDNIFIDDTPALSIMEMRSKCRRLKAEHGIDMVMVDYLQLMSAGQHMDSREREISTISRGLKALAKELKVPVIALSQLNRSLEQRSDKRPMMSDLRESGAIEQDADVIMFIYRDEVYHENSEDKGVAELIIGKQRNGSIGTARLAWLNEFTRFENLAPDHFGGI